MAKTKTELEQFKALTVGAKIDALWQVKQELAAASAVVAAVKKRFDELEATLLAEVMDGDLDGAAGKLARVSVSTTESVSIEDWEKFTAYVKKSERFELFQRRIAVTAWRDVALNEDVSKREKVPGLARFTDKKLTLTPRR